MRSYLMQMVVGIAAALYRLLKSYQRQISQGADDPYSVLLLTPSTIYDI